MDGLALLKFIKDAANWPFKVVFILFVIFASLLFPWVNRFPVLAAFVQVHVLWVGGIAVFSGLYSVWSGGEWAWRNPGRGIRLKRALFALSPEELTVLAWYLSGTSARHLLPPEHSKTAKHLEVIGVLEPTTKPSGYWTDQHTYELTIAANEILRKKRIRKELERRIAALKS